MLVTKDFVLVHVPKTGGTFLKDAITQHCEVLNVGAGFHAPYRDLPVELLHLPSIAFIRNPWAWYVSIYEHWQRHDPEPAYGREWAQDGFPRFLERCFSEPPENDRGIIANLMRYERLDYYSALFRWLTWSPSSPYLEPEIGHAEGLRFEFVNFLRRQGIENPSLVHAIKTHAESNVGLHHPYRDYYTNDKVSESWVARNFGYEFPLEPVMQS